MKCWKQKLALATALVIGGGSAAYLATQPSHAFADDMKPMTSDKDIIETATGPGMEEVTTVVAAIKAADLVEPLKGAGPFTVFAPTNEAFKKLPPGTVEDLLKPENKDKLRGILLYHVHRGDAIKAADAKTMSLTTMHEGQQLAVKVEGDTVMVNDAKVVKADVVCKNGVIHWVDTVILPKDPGMK